MESDAEYRAYEKIVKNDRRQRIATFLLLIVVLAAVLLSLAVVARNQQDLVTAAQKDSRTRNEENRRYITCLLVLPVAARDVKGQKYCFDKSDLPGGRKSSEFTPIQVNADDAAVVGIPAAAQDQSGSGLVVASSSSNDAPSEPPAQSNTSQTTPSAQLQPTSPTLTQRLQDAVHGIPLVGRLLQ